MTFPESFEFKKYNAIPVSNFVQNLYYLEKIPLLLASILKNKINRSKRMQKQVMRDYNETVWKKIFEEKNWKGAKNLNEFLFFKKDKNNRKFLMGSRLCVTSSLDYYKYRQGILCNIIQKFTTIDDEIVELGCGYGLNLFSFINGGIKNRLYGVDISENSINAAKQIANFFNCNVKFEKKDLTKDLASINLENKTAFSYYSFEQLKYQTFNLIQNLINLKPLQFLHIEPVIELYRNTARDLASSLYIKSQDYQDNLLSTLRYFEKKKAIKITDIQRLGYASNPLHEASLIRWIPEF